ncbi:MAG: hypothetical protein QXH24_06235 [Candidatus Bathyarchaeia archaeon]
MLLRKSPKFYLNSIRLSTPYLHMALCRIIIFLADGNIWIFGASSNDLT